MKVTKHAIEKFIKITGCKEGRAENKLMKLFRKSNPAEIDPRHKVKRLINNGVDNEAKYFVMEQFRFVIVDDVIVTVEQRYDHGK